MKEKPENIHCIRYKDMIEYPAHLREMVRQMASGMVGWKEVVKETEIILNGKRYFRIEPVVGANTVVCYNEALKDIEVNVF